VGTLGAPVHAQSNGEASAVAPAAQTSTPDKAAADVLFSKGRKLIAEGKVADACRAFEESYRLDPADGTLINLGVCHADEGRIATAWGELKESLTRAKKTGNAAREQLAQSRLQEIEPRLPYLTLEVPAYARLQDLEVSVNGTRFGEAVWGTPLPMDPGSVSVKVRAPGYRVHQQTFALVEKEQKRLVLPKLEPEPRAAEPTARADAGADVRAESARKASGLRYVGLALVAVGAASAGVGGYFGLSAIRDDRRADDACPKTDGRVRCSPDAVGYSEDARSKASIANVTLSVGAGLAAAGVVTWALAKRRERRSAHALQDGAGAAPASASVRLSITPTGVRLGGSF
jgi:hypothetical protein